MKTPGLRTEIVVQLSFLLGAALLLGGFLLLRLAERELLEQRVASLSATMEILAHVQEERGIDQARTGTLLQSVAAIIPHEGWVILDRNAVKVDGGLEPDSSQLSQLPLGAGPQLIIHYPPRLIPAERGGDFLLATVPLHSTGGFDGALQVRFPLDDVRRRTNSARQLIFLYALLYGAVLTVTGVFLLHRNVVRPIRGLMQVTRRIAAGDLEEVAPQEGPREIIELSHAFNRMTAALRESRLQTEANIDSLQRANEALARTRDELVRSEKMASVGNLAAGMAHEIGNPLGALIGYLGVLQGDLPAGGNREIIDRSLAEAGRIDRLVRDLLDYAAPDCVLIEPIDPVGVLREAIDILRHQRAFEGRTIQDHLPEKLPNVRIARHKLQQVCINLLLNARDACVDGKEIRLDGGTESDVVWLSVADNGGGIDAAALPHIFDPFYTTKSSGQGQGLGLFVCHRIIEEAGGRVVVRSLLGEGATFVIRFPRGEDGDDT